MVFVFFVIYISLTLFFLLNHKLTLKTAHCELNHFWFRQILSHHNIDFPEECHSHIGLRYPTLTLNNMCIPPYDKHSEATQSFYGMGVGNTTAYMYDGTPSDEFWGILATYSSNGYTKSFGHSFNTSDAAFREILMARLVRILIMFHEASP